MRDKVLRFCREQQLLPPGTHLICAVSGGADSMAMLSCMVDLQNELGISVSAAHFNHKLRGSDSDADESFVRAFCRQHDIPVVCGSGNAAEYAQAQHLSLEEAARMLRYAFFSSLDGIVATAHTADDNAETVLMNLLRGTGLRGLGGIPPRRNSIVRPMLCVTREEILQTLSSAGIPWREDATNADDFCRRNRIRHHVIPLLRQENPAFSSTILTESLLLREENEYLESLAANAAAAAHTASGYCRAYLANLPDVLLRRTLIQLLRQREIPSDSFHVNALLRLIRAEQTSGRTELPQNWQAVLSCGTLCFCREAPVPLISRILPVPGILHLPELDMDICCTLSDEMPEPSPDTVYLDHSLLTEPITVRARHSGDEIALSGGHRSLKRLMIDRKIPSVCRDRIPVLAMGKTVLAVCNLGVSRDYLPKPGNRVLAVQFKTYR